MKLKDVTYGETYLTKIGESLARVVVLGEAYRGTYRGNGPTRFWVRREGEVTRLPKPRTAAALRPIP